MKVTARVQVCNKSDLDLPKYAHPGDSGVDLCAIEDTVISPRSTTLVKTGLYVSIPEGYELQIRSRSGVALKEGIFVLDSPGTVTGSCKEQIEVVLCNIGIDRFFIKKGDRIAYATLCPVARIEWMEIESREEFFNPEEYKGTSLKVSCAECWTDFYIPFSRLKNKEKFFCSKECGANFRKAEPNVTCAVCGVEFHVKPKRLKRLKKDENICCSKECGNKLREVTYLGENNHQYGLKGELNDSFKSDIRISSYGYILVRQINHPFVSKGDFIFLHRLLMEEYLKVNEPDSPYLIEVEGYKGTFLNPECVVHHNDGDKLNNTIQNLKCMSRGDHTRLHNKMRDYARDYNGNFSKINGKKDSIGNLTKKYKLDAGLDVCSSEGIIVPAKGSALVSTDLKIAIPDYHVGLLWSRSGLSVKHKIEVGAGCIDSTYRGEVKVHLYNYGEENFTINIGDRIAQLLTIPINVFDYVNAEDLEETERNLGGFGSTGL